MRVPRSADPFPRQQFGDLVRRIPRYARLAWSVARDPALPRGRRTILLAAAGYLASPIDLVPGIIPLAGQLDDAAVVLLALRHALRGLEVEAREAHLRGADLTMSDIDRDLSTVRACAAWLGRQGARLSWRAAKATARGLGRAAVRIAARR